MNRMSGLWILGAFLSIASTGYLLNSDKINSEFVKLFSKRSEYLLPPGTCPGGNTVGGQVFMDMNFDGTSDGAGGWDSIYVYITDCNGTVDSVRTDANGRYYFNLPGSAGLSTTGPWRVEFKIPDDLCYLFPTLSSATNGGLVQRVTSTNCTTNLGLGDPEQYCQSNPMLAVPCYVSGNPNLVGKQNLDVFVKWSYNNSGTVPGDKTAISDAGQIGSTWGLAYERSTKQMYVAPILKTHIGLGNGGLDVIYKVDPFLGTPNGVEWLDLGDLGIQFSSYGTGLNDGQFPDNVTRGLNTEPNYDTIAYSRVGTVGIGDLEISADESTLYFVNMYDKKLYAIDIATKTLVSGFPVVIPSPTCTGGTNRPWALGQDEGKIYVGTICDGSTSGANPKHLASTVGINNLSATVYRLEGTGFQQVLGPFLLNYEREPMDAYNGIIKDSIDSWYPWTNGISKGNGYNSGTDVALCYPTPILTDIEFDDNNNLILGFTDRTSFQIGEANYGNISTGTSLFSSVAGGDILKACKNIASNSSKLNTWVIEGGACKSSNNTALGSNTGTYPGWANTNGGLPVGEFYSGDFFNNGGTITAPGTPGHGEITIGGLTVLPKSGELVSTAYDPVTGAPNYGTGGVIKLSNTTGQRTVNGFQVYSGSDVGTAGKGVGLGDLEILCDPPPIEIGNYVWFDEDKDGIQDPCEPPLSGVKVSLYDANKMLINTVTTGTNGQYKFLSPQVTGKDTFYVVFGDGQTVGGTTTVGGVEYNSTVEGTGSSLNPDNTDSDGQSMGGMFAGAPFVLVTGPVAGADQSYDMGFKRPQFFDAALVKTFVSVSPGPTATIGSMVTFKIKYCNQGTDTINNLKITDYINDGYSPAFSVLPYTAGIPNTMSANADSIVFNLLPGGIGLPTGGLAPAKCDSFQIVLTVVSGANAPNLVNMAEISGGTDVKGLTAANDIDSDPDSNPTNDAGSDASSPANAANDSLNGDGSGLPDDGIAATDEDDADAAGIDVFDLALRKTVNAGTPPPYMVGNTITYDITVINQGTLPATNIVIKDTFPCGLTFSPSGTWTTPVPMTGGPGYTTNTIASLAAGASTTITISFIINNTTPACNGFDLNKAYTNFALIQSATGGADIDSDPGSMTTEEYATTPNMPGDNDVLSAGNTGIGSQDDNDPANIQIFDLALDKKINPSSVPPFYNGTTITFDICVYNQGNLQSDSIIITDKLPSGFDFAGTQVYAWVYNPGTHTASLSLDGADITPFGDQDDTLDPGESACVTINLVLKNNADDYVNRAEISGATSLVDTNTTGGAPEIVKSFVTSDNDSPLYDTDPTNDPGGNPNTGSDNAIMGNGQGAVNDTASATDADHSDPAFVPVVDFALRKTIVTAGPFAIGDTVKFKISVFNQGNIRDSSIVITDYVPSGLLFDAALNPGWSGTPSITLGGIVPGGQIDTCILLIIQGGFNSISDYTNEAEISEVYVDEAGADILGLSPNTDISTYDIDSDPNAIQGDDAGADNTSPLTAANDSILGDGSGAPDDGIAATDEDDADPAFVQIHDVALKKLYAGGTVDIGQTVTFNVWVYNQGNVTMDSISVIDYIPAGYTFMNNLGWVTAGSNAKYSAIVSIAPGDSLNIPIQLTISPLANASNLVNIAEVLYSRDTVGGTIADDPDSPGDLGPNGDPTNNGGGLVNSTSDNVVNGDGTGVPGDANAATDEDNSDPAGVTLTIYSIGNLVWQDANNNGIVDPTESPIDSVILELYKLDATTGNFLPTGDVDTTDANGKYLFDSLTAGKYIVVISSSSFTGSGPLVGMLSSTGGGTDFSSSGPYADPNSLSLVATNGDNNDNGYSNTNFAGAITSDTIMLMNGGAPTNETDVLAGGVTDTTYDQSGAMNSNSDLTIDFGFAPMYSLGNLVWTDTNNNGLFDGNETGIPGVEVILHYFNGSTCVAIDTQITDGNGKYLFDTLPAGQYLIEISSANFVSGGVLDRYVSSNGEGTDITSTSGTTYEDPNNPIDPDNNIESDDNGIYGTSAFPNSVISDTINLGIDGDEPISGVENPDDAVFDRSGALDKNSNLTIDFGFVPLHSVGNQIWVDANNNGVLDPGEAPIPGVKVILHYVDTTGGMSVCVSLDSMITGPDGQYLFDSLIAGRYIIEIAASNFGPGGALAGYGSSTGSGPNTDDPGAYEMSGIIGNPDSSDHGYTIPVGAPMFGGSVISDTLDLGNNEPTGEVNDTTASGDNFSNLHIDFGFYPLHSLGNTVWADADNDGIKDAGEAALDSVLVILHYYDPITMTCIALDSVLTDANGDYLFDSLKAGTYLVEVAASNFASGGPLAGYASSTGTNGSSTGPYEDGVIDPDGVNTADSDDNGTTIGDGSVWSDSIALGENEPIGVADSADLDDTSGALDANSNLTIDFGFYPLHSIGNVVWIDTDNDGIKDAAEAGVENVLVILHYYDGAQCIVTDSVYTDANGGYLFDSLKAGKYLIEIDETNFLMGAPLEGYASSSGAGANDLSAGPNETAPDPDNNIDSDDNGTMDGNANFPGSVFSDTLDLNGNEPIGAADSAGLDDNSGALDALSNLTVDFGFVPMHSLGNTVWIDTNNDGIKQDAELGIENVKVILHYYDPVTMTCVVIDSTVTDASGGYLFDSLIAGTYLIEIPSSNFDPGGPLAGYASSTGSNGNSSGPYEDGQIMSDADQIDSDDNGTTLVTGSVWSDSIKLVTGAEPISPVDTAGLDDTSGALDENSDLTIDFGFYPLHSIGNSVWEDGNNNGIQDPGENGIDSVLVILHYFDGMQCIATDSVYTDPDGGYLFDSLIAGKYLVEIAAINFLPGGPLATYASSSGALADNLTSGPNEVAPDPDNNADLDDNGTMNGNPMFPGSVFSDTLDLNGNEPIGAADSAGLDDTSGALDANSNLTVDFGFVPMHSLGNLVWIDANNNGIADQGEGVIENVMVILHWVDPSGGGCVAVDTQFTDASGKYLFDSLIAGNYLIEIDETNFLSGGPLNKYASSTGGTYDLTTTTGSLYEDAANPNDPDNNADNDDNGILNSNTNFIGSVMSDTIALNGNEPTDETDGTTGATDTTYDASGAANERSNLTVDFGFVPLHSIGNQLFSDANNDGFYNPADGDLPLSGVAVVLHYVDTFGGGSICRAIDTVITGPDGLYYFDSLIAGRYIIEIPGFNFDAGAPLENYASSTGNGLGGSTTTGPNEDELNPIDPNNPIDNYDKGVYQHSGPFLGSVVSDTLDLGEDEPIDEADNDTTAVDVNGNMTMDFGFIELHSLGNMVFTDRNNDGIYDPLKEQVIPGVVMELHQVISNGDGGFFCVIVGTDTTDENGLYVFDSLLMGQYIVAISASNFDASMGGVLAKGFVSSTGTGNSYVPGVGPYEAQTEPTEWDDQSTDNNDNGSLMATIGSPLDGLIASDTIDLGDGTEPLNEDPYNDSTVTDGNNNLTIDFGLIPLNSIGNQVWWDANNNGLFDRATEIPLDSVEVVLHWYNEDAGVCIALDTVLTDATGRYLFGYLLEGKYLVEITAQNFLPGGPLAGFASSTAGTDLTSGPYETLNALTDGDSDVDDTDHGIKNLGFPGSVASDTITITSGKEPSMGAEFDPEYDTTGAPYPANATPDSNSNLTIDFGFVPLHSIGNQIFADYENDGSFTPGIDEPVAGVVVILHYVDPVSGTCIALDTFVTGADGLYLFDSLNGGKYIVELAKSNFDPGGVLEGWFSSTGNPDDLENGPFEDAPIDPNDPNKLDAQDNGALADAGPFLGSVITDTIELTDNAEPTSTVETSVPSNDNSGALDDNSNLTIDFGFVIPCQELTCIAKVNISLDQNCQHCLSNKDVLKGKYKIPDKFFDIEIFDASGTKLPSNCIGREYLGYELTYKITSKYPCDVNSCWGRLIVEDKSGPAIICTTDTIVCSELSTLPSSGYTVKDNCSGLEAKVVIANEQFIDYGCDSVLQGRIIRQLVATDIWGNTTNCTKTYVIEKVSLANVVCPPNVVYECGQSIADAPVPTVLTRRGLIPLFPNNPSCKISVSPKDDRQNSCGSGSYKIFRTWTITDWCTGEDTICRQVIEVIDRTQPGLTNKNLGTIAANPHDCGVEISLDTLVSTDCSKVTQSFRYKYRDGAGILRVISGSLPGKIWLFPGADSIEVTAADACNNFRTGWIVVRVEDKTPPTPVCKEFTQVTVDPASCWGFVLAKDLDNGSHDNCIETLHFAAAKMADIEKARKDYEKRIIDSCGNKEYWDNKSWYDAYIEQWINCYVFSDTIHMDDCGSNQVVLRVYEADSLPRLDPHLWSCSPHAWFCYNSYPDYRIVHNINKNCGDKAPWLCKSASESWFETRRGNTSYRESNYVGANPTRLLPQTHLYNDCMVNVLVDDKQAPLVAGLEDILVYCDGAPSGSANARYYCESGESYYNWPGDIKDGKGIIHGYYGGSNFVPNHDNADDHNPSTGCDDNKWAPIYCKKWLLLDSNEQAGKIDPKLYFDQYVLFDKNRPARTLAGNEFSFTDNCKLDDGTLTESITGTLNGCGEGWLQKTWTIKDKCGNIATATQKIIVKHRSDFEVIFPADLDVACESSNATDTSQTGKPQISDDECEQVGVRYEDEISSIVDGGCYKIIRTWTLIDWCIYDVNAHTTHPDVIVNDTFRANQTDRECVFRNLKDNGDGIIKYVQIIKVTDKEAPKLSCRDTTIDMTAGCDVNVSIPLQATDNCAETILFKIDLTRPDGSTETRAITNGIWNTTFSAGTYIAVITGKDHCGNESSCTMKITVRDGKKPTPYCLNGIATVVMPSTGTLEIWAKDLDRASEDNCTPKDKLKFSFTKNTADASKVVGCKDIRDGREQLLDLDIWVTDESGNQDLCKTYILLQDNGGQPGGVCKDTTVSLANITGRLYTEDQEGVEFAEVKVTGAGSVGIPSFKTKTDGSYTFSALPMNGIASIQALRNDNPMNGVSTLDLVLIQKHILGTESLKSPYKMIAADVDNNRDISAIDLLELRKLILGIYDKLPDNTSWKFVPKSYTFDDVTNPWSYPNEDLITNMKESMTRDFVGVKVGDVNSSAVAHSLMGTEIRSTETGLIFEVEDQTFKAGDKVKVDFRSPNFAGVSGFQGTIAMDNPVETGQVVQRTMDNVTSYMVDRTLYITPGKLDLTDKNFGTRWSNEGLITMSWNEKTGIDIDSDKVLFTMTFKAEKDGKLSEIMRIGSQRTKAESYEGKGELGNLSIRFTRDGKEVSGTNTLYQNYPNPFDQRTVIGINLAQTTQGVMKITDITGRVLKTIDREWNKGYNEIWLDRRDIKATGILYYSFESLPTGKDGKSFNAVKKMILLE